MHGTRTRAGTRALLVLFLRPVAWGCANTGKTIIETASGFSSYSGNAAAVHSTAGQHKLAAREEADHHKLGSVNGNNNNNNLTKDTCSSTDAGYDISGGTRSPNNPGGLNVQSQQACCAACNADSACATWIWDTNGLDPLGKNCWPMQSISGITPNSNRVLGGALPPPPPPPPGSIRLNLGSQAGFGPSDDQARYYGTGGGGSAVRRLTVTSATPHVQNTQSVVPCVFRERDERARER